jgi:acyl carrier protein
MTTLDRVIAIAAAVLKVPPDTLNAQSSPDDVATWDSMQHLQIIMALEESFATKFAAHQIDQLQSVGALAAALEGRR